MIGSHRRIGRLGTLTIAALGAAAFLAGQAPQTAAASEPAATESAATAVVRAARAYLGAPYQHGATGPSRFDCSGLVYRAFADVGLASRIGGLQSASGLYHWFSARHLASRTSPQLGDLVVWGGGAHIGIYVGNGRAISALVDGVRIAPVSAVLSGFTAYLHTHLTTLRLPIAGAPKVAPFTDIRPVRDHPGIPARRAGHHATADRVPAPGHPPHRDRIALRGPSAVAAGPNGQRGRGLGRQLADPPGSASRRRVPEPPAGRRSLGSTARAGSAARMGYAWVITRSGLSTNGDRYAGMFESGRTSGCRSIPRASAMNRRRAWIRPHASG